jgi:hypothetical protein
MKRIALAQGVEQVTVEFSDSEALCWLHQDDDGRLATFRCA